MAKLPLHTSSIIVLCAANISIAALLDVSFDYSGHITGIDGEFNPEYGRLDIGDGFTITGSFRYDNALDYSSIKTGNWVLSPSYKLCIKECYLENSAPTSSAWPMAVNPVTMSFYDDEPDGTLQTQFYSEYLFFNDNGLTLRCQDWGIGSYSAYVTGNITSRTITVSPVPEPSAMQLFFYSMLSILLLSSITRVYFKSTSGLLKLHSR